MEKKSYNSHEIECKWKFMPDTPPRICRLDHLLFIYKGYLYVHGGRTPPGNGSASSRNHKASPLSLHCFKLDDSKPDMKDRIGNSRWFKLTAKCGNDDFDFLIGRAYALINNKVFTFGGAPVSSPGNLNPSCHNLLWRLNLDQLEWKRIDRRGEVPAPRESAKMVSFKKFLVVFGGINKKVKIIYNDLYIYSLETRGWSKVLGNYEHTIQARFQPSLCVEQQQDNFYIFGGECRDAQGREKFLNDCYELKLKFQNRVAHVDTKCIINNQEDGPQGRVRHCAYAFGNKLMLVVGGQTRGKNEDRIPLNDAWLMNTQTMTWTLLSPKGDFFSARAQFELTVNKDESAPPYKFYILGGNYLGEQPETVFMELEIPNTIENDNFKANTLHCRTCFEKQNLIQLQQHPFQSDLVEQIIEQISYPFSAFGLLLDNCMNHGASRVNVSYISKEKKSKLNQYIKIQDNSIYYPSYQLIDMLNCYQSSVNLMIQGTDKRAKQMILKEQQKRQLGTNLKLGGLRLGAIILFVSKWKNEGRVWMYCREGKNYNSYFYAVQADDDNWNILPEYSQLIRQRVENQYKDLVYDALNSREINTLFLLDLRSLSPNDQVSIGQLGEHALELKPIGATNDIVIYNLQALQSFFQRDHSISESIDISLKSYLSCLYLKNESMQILLRVLNNDLQKIKPQSQLSKIDKLVKSKKIVELDGAMKMQCKIIQLYYNEDLMRKIDYFANGVLIYHKNRLIKRHGIELGSLLIANYHKLKSIPHHYNVVNFFGCIQVPQGLSVNLSKTDFIFAVMMEKVYSRLLFIQNYYRNRLRNRLVEKQLKGTGEQGNDKDKKEQKLVESKEQKRAGIEELEEREEKKVPVQDQVVQIESEAIEEVNISQQKPQENIQRIEREKQESAESQKQDCNQENKQGGQGGEQIELENEDKDYNNI